MTEVLFIFVILNEVCDVKNPVRSITL